MLIKEKAWHTIQENAPTAAADGTNAALIAWNISDRQRVHSSG